MTLSQSLELRWFLTKEGKELQWRVRDSNDAWSPVPSVYEYDAADGEPGFPSEV